MRWWDRFIDWWVRVSETKIVGPGAPATPPWVLSEADRAWLREAAASLETGGTVVWTTAYLRLMAARMREIAG